MAWSYSGITEFDKCNKKYYHLRVVKDVKQEDTQALDYGRSFHTAAEEYIKTGVPLPPEFTYVKPTLDSLNKMPGGKHCELKLGIKKGPEKYEPCDFFDPDVWWRGIIDLAIVNNERAKLVDYKTGKSAKYADIRQLDLCAGAMFLHFPQLMVIDSALIFVISGDLIPKQHVATEKTSYIEVFKRELARLDVAQSSGIWNANPTPLCGWCPVKTCAHWRDRSGR